jgi:hypothetical protein
MLPPDCVAWRHSLVLLPHLSVLPFGSLPSYRCALSTGPTLKRRLAEAACPFSISGLNHPSYALLAKCRKSLPGSFEVPSAGFGYPLDDVSSSNPWKPSFSSQHSWDSLFRAFFLPDDPNRVSTTRSIPALPKKTAKPSRCASMAFAHPKSSASHLLPKGLVRGETSCSPEVFRPPRSSLPQADRESVSLSQFPSRPYKLSPFNNNLRNLRVSRTWGSGFSSRRRRRPAWPFSPSVQPHLFEKYHPLRAIFSPRSSQMPCGTQFTPLCSFGLSS